jgi:hypothetical protein
MSMTFAEFFVNLGVKGEGPALKAMVQVKAALGEMESTGLAAKAAIVGAIYALDQFISTAASQGEQNANLAAYLGESTDALERWKAAATGAMGPDSVGMTAQWKKAAKIIGDLAINIRPDWFRLLNVNEKTAMGPGGTEYLMKIMRDAAKNRGQWPKELNSMLGGMMSEDFISASARGLLDDKKLNRTDILHDSDFKNLAGQYEQIENMRRRFNLWKAQKTEMFGPGVIKDVKDMAVALASIEASAEKLHKSFPKMTEAVTAALVLMMANPAMRTALVFAKLLEEYGKREEGDKTGWFGDKNSGNNAASDLYTTIQKKRDTFLKDTFGEKFFELMFTPNGLPNMLNHVIHQNQTNHTTIQTPSTSPHDHAHEVHKAVKGAFFQYNSSLTQVV